MKSKKLKVLILSTNADLAGAPLHVKEVALSLAREGHEVIVVFGSHGLTQEALKSLNIKTHVLHGMRSAINPFVDLKVCRKLLNFVKEERPDIVHCHSAKAGMLGRIVSARLRIPCIYTVHGWGFGEGRRPFIAFILKYIEYGLKSFAAHTITVSDADRSSGIVDLKFPVHKLTTIKNGISFSVSPPQMRPEDARVIMVARNAYPKDYLTLARALGKSKVFSACFVGDGTDSPDFKLEMTEHSKRRCFLEFCGVRTDVSALLESASIFVLSSRHEAMPLSIIEAMSKGLPIVASDVGGVSELVSHGVNGYLFTSGDFNALAEYLDLLANDIDLRRRMGKESIDRYLSEYSTERMMNQILKVYDQALDASIK